MSRLLKYDVSTGHIAGCWEGVPEYVLAQIDAAETTYGYLEDVVADVPPATLFAQWYVVADVLTEKTEVIITATLQAFAADGVTECLITVEPFVACTLLVNGTPMALTTEDATLELTSEIPMTFTMTLQALATHWALPLTVEAT